MNGASLAVETATPEKNAENEGSDAVTVAVLSCFDSAEKPLDDVRHLDEENASEVACVRAEKSALKPLGSGALSASAFAELLQNFRFS